MGNKTADDYRYKYLKNGSSIEMNVDGSAVTVNFDYIVVDHFANLARMNINLLDGGESPMEFAGLGTALTNGCLLQIVDIDGTTVLQHFGTDDAPLIKNADFNMLAGVDVTHRPDPGTDLLSIRFSINKVGAPMRLKAGQIIRLVVQDDLTSVSEFRVMAQLLTA